MRQVKQVQTRSLVSIDYILDYLSGLPRQDTSSRTPEDIWRAANCIWGEYLKFEENHPNP